MNINEHRSLKQIPVDRLIPHPDNPRKNLGDLTELTESVKTVGILQNLTVTPAELVEGVEIPDDNAQYYVVIIGHRRLAAAKAAGLETVPCADVEMDRKEQLTTMLLENMQRSDLTVYEQAQGFQMMIDLGASVEEVAEKSGFSQTTVRRRLKIAELDQETLRQVSQDEGRQLSLSDFDKLAEIKSIKTRNKLLKDIGTYSFEYGVKGAIREQHRNEVIPLAKKQLKEMGATPLPETERYSSSYEDAGHINLDVWEPENGIKHSGRKNDELFYHIDHYGTLSLFQKKKRTVKKKSKEEIEKERAIADAQAVCKETTAVAYELRKAFIDHLPVTQKKLPILLKGAAIAISISATLYLGISRKTIARLYGVDPDGSWNVVREQTVEKAIANEDPMLLPQIIYTAFSDSDTNRYYDAYSGSYPHHTDNLKLDALYAWLSMLGYQMSDDERAMKDGTHEVLHRGDEK